MSRCSYSERDEAALRGSGTIVCYTCGVFFVDLVGHQEQDADQYKLMCDHVRMCIERAAALKQAKSVA